MYKWFTEEFHLTEVDTKEDWFFSPNNFPSYFI